MFQTVAINKTEFRLYLKLKRLLRPNTCLFYSFHPPSLLSLVNLACAPTCFEWQSRARRRCAWTWTTSGLAWEKRRDFGPLLLSFMEWRHLRLMSALISINLSLFPIKPAKQRGHQSFFHMEGSEPASLRRGCLQRESRLLHSLMFVFFSNPMCIVCVCVCLSVCDNIVSCPGPVWSLWAFLMLRCVWRKDGVFVTKS